MDDFEQSGMPKPGGNNSPQLKSTVTPQMPLTMPLQPREKTKKKFGLIILVVVLSLALVGGVVWLVVANKNDTNGGMATQLNELKNNDSKKTADEPAPKNEIVALSVDDKLVKTLWGYFNTAYFSEMIEDDVGLITPFAPLDKLYSEKGALSPDGLSDELKLAIAIQTLFTSYDTGEFCKGDYDFLRWTDTMGVEHPGSEIKACHSGDVIRANIQKIFGDDISLTQFDGQTFIIAGEGWEYSASNDEIVDRASGATIRPINRVLLKAERDNERIYIYEAVGYAGCWMTGQQICSVNKLDGTEIASGEEVTQKNIRSLASELDKFKWTFTWNGENYVFEKLEQIQF